MYLRKSYLYNSIMKDVSYSLKQILDETLGSLYLNDKEKSIVDKYLMIQIQKNIKIINYRIRIINRLQIHLIHYITYSMIIYYHGQSILK